METPEIVSHLAQLMRQRGLWENDAAKQAKVRQQPTVPDRDAVEFTKAASQYAASGAEDDYAAEQAMKVERLKALVQSGKYHMDQDMVEQIAGNIAKMLV